MGVGSWVGGGWAGRGNPWLLGWMRSSGPSLLSPGVDKETQRGPAKACPVQGYPQSRQGGVQALSPFYTQVASPSLTLTLAKLCVACRASFHGDPWDRHGFACLPPPYSVVAQPGCSEASKPQEPWDTLEWFPMGPTRLTHVLGLRWISSSSKSADWRKSVHCSGGPGAHHLGPKRRRESQMVRIFSLSFGQRTRG